MLEFFIQLDQMRTPVIFHISNTALDILGASLTVKDRVGNNANLSLPNPGSKARLVSIKIL